MTKRRGGITIRRYYHRATKTPLPSDYGSPEFIKAWAALQGTQPVAAVLSPSANSYGALRDAYRADSAFTRLQPRTQDDYNRVFRWMSARGADDRPASSLNQARCEKLLDLAVRDLGWRQGCYVLQVNRRLYNWLLERSDRKSRWGAANPWETLPAPRRLTTTGPKKNRPWKPEEIAEVLHAAPIGLRRAYVLGASGFDGGTLLTLRWEDCRPDGIEAVRKKTHTASFVMVPRVLRPLLEDGDRPSEFIVTSMTGEPFSLAGLRNRSSELLRQLAKEGRVGPGLTLHGLRHTIGKAIAESGGSLHAIQGALQHKSPRMALYYSAQADKKRALLASAGALDEWFGLQTGTSLDCKLSKPDEEKSS